MATNSAVLTVWYLLIALQTSEALGSNSPASEKAPMILGIISLIGIVIQFIFTYYFLNRKTLENDAKIALLQSHLAKANEDHLTRLQHRLELDNERQIAELHSKLEYQTNEQLLALQARQQTKSKRREELESLFKVVCDARFAAEQLRDTAVALPHIRLSITAGALQKMASFFERAKEAERSLLLQDVEKKQVTELQAELTKIFLTLDLDQKDTDYCGRLTTSYAEFEKRFITFQGHVKEQVFD